MDHDAAACQRRGGIVRSANGTVKQDSAWSKDLQPESVIALLLDQISINDCEYESVCSLSVDATGSDDLSFGTASHQCDQFRALEIHILGLPLKFSVTGRNGIAVQKFRSECEVEFVRLVGFVLSLSIRLVRARGNFNKPATRRKPLEGILTNLDANALIGADIAGEIRTSHADGVRADCSKWFDRCVDLSGRGPWSQSRRSAIVDEIHGLDAIAAAAVVQHGGQAD